MIESNKFAVMKFISRHKLLFSSMLVVWIVGMIFTVMLIGRSTYTKIQFSVKNSPLSLVTIHPLQHNRLPPPSSFKMVKALRYCNPPNDITIGQEGRAPGNHSLEFVAMVIRHGDRSPLRPVRNQSIINCGTNQNHPFLKKYLATLKSIHRRTKKRYPFTTFPLYPSEKQCSSAQMTIIGSQQHLQLGYLMSKVYNNRFKLLTKNWSADHLKVYSTVYSRTYQSAIAFLFGFLPSFNFSSIKIIPSGDTRFCMSECRCPLLDHLQRMMDKKTHRLLSSHPAVVHLLQLLNPIVKFHPNHSNITSPMAMLDSLMGYVCHGSHLPCIPGKHNCVTIDHVRNLLAFMDWEGKQFVEDSTHKKTSLLKMHGLLSNLLQNMQDVINKKATHRFALYSGHDITLIPLASALGFDDGVIPPYASRVNFELYRNNNVNDEHKYLMKVLYNGKDVTKYTPFCKMFFKVGNMSKSSLFNVCPLENFVKFVEDDFFVRMNATSFTAACDLARTTSDPFELSSYAEAAERL